MLFRRGALRFSASHHRWSAAAPTRPRFTGPETHSGTECVCGLPVCVPSLCPALYAGGWATAPGDALAPYQGSSSAVISAALELANFQAGESLVDVGAGDGRILAAALAAGAGKATGFELQPDVHALGCAALDAALGAATARRKQATLLLGDVREHSLPQGVDVLTMFLLPVGLAALECWLSKQLEVA